MSDLFDQEELELLALAVPAISPGSALRSRILKDAWRWDTFVFRLSQLIEVSMEQARNYLELLEKDWHDKLLPSVSLIHLQGGPSLAGLDVGFVRVQAGSVFPWHKHLGREEMLILQGSALCSDGAVLQAGMLITCQPEAHSFQVPPKEDLIFAVITEGVEFGSP